MEKKTALSLIFLIASIALESTPNIPTTSRYQFFLQRNQLSSILGLIGELKALEHAYNEQNSAYHYEIVQSTPEEYQAYLNAWVQKIIHKLWNLELSILPNTDRYKQQLAEAILHIDIATDLGIIPALQSYAEEQIRNAKTPEQQKAAITVATLLQLLISPIEWQLWLQEIQAKPTVE